MKLADISRTKRKNIRKLKIEELETNSEIKKTLETCIGASMTYEGLPA